MEKTCFNKNLAALKTHCPDIEIFLDKKNHAGNISVDTDTISGIPTIKVKIKKKTFYLHSRIDPKKEAERFVSSYKDLSEKTAVVVFGFACGYHIETIMDDYPGVTKIIVIDCNSEVMRCAMEARDLTGIFNDARIRVIAGAYKDIVGDILGEVEKLSTDMNARIIIHTPSLKALPESEKDAHELFEYIHSIKIDKQIRPFEKIARALGVRSGHWT